MTDLILDVQNLDMHFPTGAGLFGKATGIVRAVDRVSLSVQRGETFGIVGESGSGKTTLGRSIMRILEPTGGRADYHGMDKPPVDLVASSRNDLRKIWRDIRMVFQDPQASLNLRLPVIEIVDQVLRKTESLKGQNLADRVSSLLVQLGLRPELLHRYPGAFSGGQCPRLGIARALAIRPELVIANEAASALDVSIQAQTLTLLQDLQESFDLSYIFIAHDLAIVDHICDRIAVMYQGQIVELASRDELFGDPKHPYTRTLLSAAPVPDPRARKKKQKRTSMANSTVADTGCRFATRSQHTKDLCRQETPPNQRIGGTGVLCHFAGSI